MDDLQLEDEWSVIIKPKAKGLNLNLKEVWKYRDLLYMYIKRDFIATYKQTILGPTWFFIQPIFTTLVFMFVFGGIAQLPTDGIPQPLFYMAGLVMYNYFLECLNRTSTTFSTNASVFSKVYFPRLVVPISGLISSMLKMFIQLALFFAIYLYFWLNGADISMNLYALLFPLLIIMAAGIGFGGGVIISSMTVRYRDLIILFTFAVSLIIYLTPVVYPLSAIPEKYARYKWVIQLNPLSSIIETFKYSMLGEGEFSWPWLLYSLIFAIAITIIGIVIFNKVERRFVDVI